ncbi:MAG: hypothetical protein H7641_14180 [Candidatus Heimdallarchaeota archaeon]|nr:hypothetical protein [Candidatus Heimdallarchaeota archaeon]MCK4878710.1 hypothetical protein [Candidatus Heimdallarchaeota archaeon]
MPDFRSISFSLPPELAFIVPNPTEFFIVSSLIVGSCVVLFLITRIKKKKT